MPTIDPAMRYTKKTVEVLGKRMAVVDEGEGDRIVFLHGNITSSYLYRNIMPYVQDVARIVSVENIGQGDSAKLDDSGPGRYRLS